MGAAADTLRTVLPMPRNGGGGLRFSLFGFPIRIHPWFLIVAGIIGFSGPEPNLARALVWIGVVLVSVLVHELGHAFAARTVGAEPTIDLYALGGLTAFAPPRPPSAWPGRSPASCWASSSSAAPQPSARTDRARSSARTHRSSR
jgi:hypothetical protein